MSDSLHAAAFFVDGDNGGANQVGSLQLSKILTDVVRRRTKQDDTGDVALRQ